MAASVSASGTGGRSPTAGIRPYVQSTNVLTASGLFASQVLSQPAQYEVPKPFTRRLTARPEAKNPAARFNKRETWARIKGVIVCTQSVRNDAFQPRCSPV